MVLHFADEVVFLLLLLVRSLLRGLCLVLLSTGFGIKKLVS